MPPILDDEDIRITHMPGDGQTAIIAFGGISAGLGGIQIEEFRKSLSGFNHDVFFVIEKTPRWYNGTFRRIADAMRAVLSEGRFSQAITLGNSMGGFGALAFADRLPHCVRAIAFGPQSSVHPRIVPFEDRWRDIRLNIETWEVPDAVPLLSSAIEYVVIVGSDRKDVRHAERLASPGLQLSTIRIKGGGHEVASYVKARGAMNPLLHQLIGRGDVKEAKNLLDVAGLTETYPQA